MKVYIYKILFAINLLALILAIFHMILFWYDFDQSFLDFVLSLRMYSTYFILILWIWNMIIWGKKDKKVIRFVALFFLSGFYNLFYFKIAMKNKWLVE